MQHLDFTLGGGRRRSALIYGPESLGVKADLKQSVPGIVALAAIRAGQITTPASALAIVVFGYHESCITAAWNDKQTRPVVIDCGGRFLGSAHH
jgi:hypothetical protein